MVCFVITTSSALFSSYFLTTAFRVPVLKTKLKSNLILIYSITVSGVPDRESKLTYPKLRLK